MCVLPQWEWSTLLRQLCTLSLVRKDFYSFNHLFILFFLFLKSAISNSFDNSERCSLACVALLISHNYLAGDSQPLDVCSVHQASALVRYSVSLLGYGFYGDVLAESEKHRWMGPLRYDYSGMYWWVIYRTEMTPCWLDPATFSVFTFSLKLKIHPETVTMTKNERTSSDIYALVFSFPNCSPCCVGTMMYLCNRSYAGIVQYVPADPVLSSPRDRTRCLSG